jgi:hypothetical protein
MASPRCLGRARFVQRLTSGFSEEQVFDAFYEDSQGEEPSGDSERLPNGNYKCKHKCKAACQHVCCKEGVKPKSRARANRAPAAPV